MGDTISMKTFNFLFISLFILSILISSEAISAAQKVSLAKVKRIVKLQNKLASNPELYARTFTVLYKGEDARFLAQQFKSLKVKTLPKVDLIGDTLYIKNKSDSIKFKLDLNDSNRVWINGKEYVADSKKSLAANYNSLVSLMRPKKAKVGLLFEEAFAQSMEQESFAVTAAYTYFTSWWYSKPDRYIPRSLEEVTDEGWFSDSRYCELDGYELEKMSDFKDNPTRTTDAGYYKWAEMEVFPGYLKEMEHFAENYVEDAKDKFPNGIRGYESLLEDYKKATQTAGLDDDKAAEKGLGFYEQITSSMVESDLRYFGALIGEINNQIAAKSNNVNGCVTANGISMSCLMNQTSENKEILSLIKQRQCVGRLVSRRQEYLRSHYSKYYCGENSLKSDKNISQHPIDGIYQSTYENCRDAVESQLIKRNFFCAEKLAVPTYDPQTNEISALQNAKVCDGYFAPICFRQNSNIARNINCEGKRPSTQCACVPQPSRGEANSKLYREKSGGRY